MGDSRGQYGGPLKGRGTCSFGLLVTGLEFSDLLKQVHIYNGGSPALTKTSGASLAYLERRNNSKPSKVV